ncbi:acyl-CoA dehydrogenase family protein [Yinghuangia seranimata]|uniref:acyl-CoA dehydrogenase family protein n=1 Tax=Yinghuangia seranimata TaxID=408067 RepID=UPI00248D18DB|nr:acyl-CoA dehydrogenase family protein [Yinghuangia seranimata]MDI2132408.1 acyl-CoA dehydrogenase family protein [Yinghuangia seranimata]
MSEYAEELRGLVSDVVGGTPVEARSSDEVWRKLAELGLPLVGVDEAAGGSGGSYDDLVTVVRALGEHATGLPVGESALASWALAHDRAAGERVTLAFGMDAVYEDDLSVVRIPCVPWLRQASAVVVYGRSGGATYVDLDAPGVEVHEGVNLAGEPRDDLVLRGAAMPNLPGAPDLAEARARFGLLRSVAVAGAAVGAYTLTRGYVMQREQFGKPLARIPAVATALATMRVATVRLDAALERAVANLARSGGTSQRFLAAAAAAGVTAAATAATCARTAHQLHGAMGVTAEYPLHHYTKRLWSWPEEAGAEADCARYLGQLALAGGEAAVWDELTC